VRYYLVGFMGSGKSTVGVKLAKKLGFDFLDLDVEIEQSEKLSITSIFETHGEDYFRQKESEYLRQTSRFQNTVISCGGGTPCHSNNMDWILENGKAIYLQLNTGSILSRLKLSLQTRPMLANKSITELSSWIRGRLEERSPFYLRADLVINSLSVDYNTIKDWCDHNISYER
jgi:shikimate kinase